MPVTRTVDLVVIVILEAIEPCKRITLARVAVLLFLVVMRWLVLVFSLVTVTAVLLVAQLILLDLPAALAIAVVISRCDCRCSGQYGSNQQ